MFQLVALSACCVLAQYSEEGGGGVPVKKPTQILSRRLIKTQRISTTLPVTAQPLPQSQQFFNGGAGHQRFRRPQAVSRTRPASEPIPQIPVFTHGIKSGRPSQSLPQAPPTPAALSGLELQSDDASTASQQQQQPHIVYPQPTTPSQHFSNEFKPVTEESDKDEDAARVIASGGISSGSSNLLTPSSTPAGITASSFLPTVSAYQPEPRQHHYQIQQQQIQPQLLDRNNNEYELNEARPPVKQRPQIAPKKSKPQADYYDSTRPKKPVAQVVRRYREETADGSIIWGFENDDGSFKEEMIGIDCITRGKYGYVDPDGVRREYTYETGIKCNEEAQKGQDQDILNTFVDYQENKLVLPSGKTIDLSSMGKKQHRRPQPVYRN
ncbi:hypothetical protein QAD02_000987 [Eretmocerus hayati]|uniref:Uncharacterized protein n=1 Tax=Eretmocerus hayati TaxID=131215 RepID=A0ACC2NEZ8_9HYME|nr:hypothetical protein QAD02_000987 [Eretmocerus hayati]